MTIQNARSNVAGNTPPGSVDGQIQVQQADDALFTHKPDGTTRITLLPKRRGIADSLIAIGPRETYIGVSSLTAGRVAALPAAATYPVGHPLTITDESGACSPTVPITITAAGADRINGSATLVLSAPYAGIALYSDGASRWTTGTLPAAGAANAVLFVQQSLAVPQQDQARLNVGGAVPAAQGATTALAPLDIDRAQVVTGSTTLTMPSSVAPGWGTGPIVNDNAAVGLVVLAIPSGHSVDGVINGSTTLFPKQRARLRLVSAGAWRTEWIERAPSILRIPFTGQAALTFSLPVGYDACDLDLIQCAPSAAVNLLLRLSDDGGATFKQGAADYVQNNAKFTTGGTITPGAYPAHYLTEAPIAGTPVSGRARIFPGGSGLSPQINSDMNYLDNGASAAAQYFTKSRLPSISVNRANAMQIFPNAGSISGVAILRGVA